MRLQGNLQQGNKQTNLPESEPDPGVLHSWPRPCALHLQGWTVEKGRCAALLWSCKTGSKEVQGTEDFDWAQGSSLLCEIAG